MRRSIALVLALSLAACGPNASPGTPESAPDPARVAGARTLSDAVDRASAEYRVPREVLLALAYAEGRWLDPGIPTEESGVAGEAHSGIEIGPLHLRRGVAFDSLARAIALLRTDDATLRGDLGLQVAGAAAVLAELGRETGASESDVDSWAEAVARYSCIEGREAQVDYARQVWEALRQGRREATFTGETILLQGRNGPSIEDLLHVDQNAQATDDYGPARWVAASSSNYTVGRDGSIQYVVIHDTEGSYAGAISWFQNSAAGASAHYVLRSSDGQVTQMVRHTNSAWHAGSRYINHRSIGIEHEGYYTAPERWYTEAMYVASARLTRALCDRYSIPIDRSHIIGHYQVYRDGRSSVCTGSWDTCRAATGNHVDPGPGWNWAHYMDLVRGGGTTGPMYDADLVTVNYPRDMNSGERAVAYVEYRNTGSATWDVTNTRIGTTQPRDHAGRLFDSVNWLNNRRPTAVDRATANGAVGRFSFMIQAPTVTADTTVTESYGLVQEGTAWFGPADSAVTLTVRVHAPAAPPRDAGVAPDASAARDAASGSDAASTSDVASTSDAASAGDSASGRDSGTAGGADAGARGDGGTGNMAIRGCGCRIEGTGRAGSARGVLGATGAVIAAAAVGVARRRRRQRGAA